MRFTFAFLLLFGISHLKADIGSCFVYKAKYVLKNGQSFIGYLPISGYDVAPIEGKDRDKLLQKLITRHFYIERRKLHINIYKKIHVLRYKDDEKTKSLMPIPFAFVDSTEVIRLHIDSIKYTVYLDAKLSNFEWYVCGISIFDSTSVQKFQKSRVRNFIEINLTTPELELEGGGAAAYIINFSSNNSQKDLISIRNEVKKQSIINTNNLGNARNLNLKFKKEQQKKFLEWREKGIFIFYYSWGPC